MYEYILNLLKNKYLGVNDTILSRVAKKLAETAKTEDEAKTEVEGVTFQKLLDSYGDSRATEATKTAVANYEKKHNLKDGKTVETPKVETSKETQEEGVPEWAKKLMANFDNLSKKVDGFQGNELERSRKQKLDEVLTSLPEHLRKGYARIDVKSYDEEGFSNLLTEITSEVGDIAKHQSIKRSVFGKPTVTGASIQSQTNTEEATEDEVNDVMKHMNV